MFREDLSALRITDSGMSFTGENASRYSRSVRREKHRARLIRFAFSSLCKRKMG